METKAQESIQRICLWSGPRNVSTALMYSFAQRRDCKVFDEPLYAYYLANSNANSYHPGAEDVLNSLPKDGNEVIDMMLQYKEKPVLFFKHMTHHLLDLDKEFLNQTVNIILTRDPKEMIPSFHKVIPYPSIDDLGYKAHHDLLEYFKERNIKYAVLDSKRLLLDPKETLTKLSSFIGIPFDESMLKWKAGAIPEDGVWAKFWYENVHKSTGFIAYQPKKENPPEELKSIIKECEFYYKQLIEEAL